MQRSFPIKATTLTKRHRPQETTQRHLGPPQASVAVLTAQRRPTSAPRRTSPRGAPYGSWNAATISKLEASARKYAREGGFRGSANKGAAAAGTPSRSGPHPQCGDNRRDDILWRLAPVLRILCRDYRTRNEPAQTFCGKCGAYLEPGALLMCKSVTRAKTQLSAAPGAAWWSSFPSQLPQYPLRNASIIAGMAGHHAKVDPVRRRRKDGASYEVTGE
jgi:hypothetical protein